MRKQKGLGLIGVLLIIGALILAGGVVVWEKKVAPTVTPPPIPVAPSPTPLVLSPTPTASPTTPTQDADFISWEEVKQLILTGKVEQVHEFRNLTVYLFLKDGTTRTTKEPRINAVSEIIDQCGKPCFGIMRAIE